MVTVVTFNHCWILVSLICAFTLPVTISSVSVPTKSPNVTNQTAKVTHPKEQLDQGEETQLQQSLLPNYTKGHVFSPSIETSDQQVSKIESQIEKQPQLTAEASQHEPASVRSYHDQSGNSDAYKGHVEHKLYDQGAHHDRGKSDSYGKDWDKVKEKERRVKDRGSGFIKAFTWDREEVSKDKYKDKGSEKSNHEDHSKGAEYEHKKESSQAKSGHRNSGKNRSAQNKGNDEKINYNNHQTDSLDGEVLAYDPNVLLYANSLNNLPSTEEMYIQPGYGGIDGTYSAPQYYIQPVLY